MLSKPEISIVMPCLNEIETLETCIRKAQKGLSECKIQGEIIVADNGSTDGSQALALSLGAKVVNITEKGYGSALMGGIEAAQGEYVLMGDSDDSYDFSDIEAFIEKLREGKDLVMGNRFKGGIRDNAMPFLNRYLGNPVLSFVGRVFFSSPVGDFHCGMRAFSKKAYQSWGLQTTGMEFATEMVVKATLLKQNITEVPIFLYPDGRSRPPHLRRWRDGWRHLRFMCLYAPAWLFLYPGLLLMVFGLFFFLLLIRKPLDIGVAVLDITTLLYSALIFLTGFQALLFYFKTRIFAGQQGFLPYTPSFFRLFDYFTLERGLIAGGLLCLIGIGVSFLSLNFWANHHFGPLDPSSIIRIGILAFLCLLMGIQIIFSSLFFSILGLQKSVGKSHDTASE